MKIALVEPESIAEEIGLRVGDDLLEVNGHKMLDSIDYRFHEHDEEINLKVARDNEVILYDIEKDAGERLGLDFEEMNILSCGNDCSFFPGRPCHSWDLFLHGPCGSSSSRLSACRGRCR